MKETTKHREAFEVWYKFERDFGKIWQNMAVPERTLRNWAGQFDWHERADERDKKVAAKVEQKAVEQRVKKLEEHGKAGRLMRLRATQHYSKPDFQFENTRDATTAMKVGIEIERQSEGLPDYIFEILNADAATLHKRFTELDARRRAALPDDGRPAGEPVSHADDFTLDEPTGGSADQMQ